MNESPTSQIELYLNFRMKLSYCSNEDVGAEEANQMSENVKFRHFILPTKHTFKLSLALP